MPTILLALPAGRRKFERELGLIGEAEDPARRLCASP